MYQIIPTLQFEQDVKYYVKKKGYTHIDQDIKNVTNELERGNLIGVELTGVSVATNGHTFKVRLANSDAKVGQSNGYRIIYYAIREDQKVYLLTIYSKKDDNRIPTNQEIIHCILEYCQ